MLEEILTRALMFCICYFVALGCWRIIKHIRMIKIVTQSPVVSVVSGQEDPRTQEAIARTRAAFNDQQKDMSARALKAHEANCETFMCTKDICFKRTPDKIVLGSEKIIEPFDKKRRKEREELLNSLEEKKHKKPIKRITKKDSK